MVPLDQETSLRDQLLDQGETVIMTIYTDQELAALGITNGHAANIPAYGNKLAQARLLLSSLRSIHSSLVNSSPLPFFSVYVKGKPDIVLNL